MTTIGIAAIGAYIRRRGLGREILAGLARIGSPRALDHVLDGVLGIVLLAVLFDLLDVLIVRLTIARGSGDRQDRAGPIDQHVPRPVPAGGGRAQPGHSPRSRS